MYIFSEQTFIDVYTEFMLTFHNLNKILSKVVLHVKMQKIHKVFSQLSAAFTSVQLMMCCIGPHPVLLLLLDTFSTAK